MSLAEDTLVKPEVRLTDAVDLLRSCAAESVAVLPTDPPYGVSYQSNRRKETKTKPIAGDWNFPVGELFTETARVLRKDGAMWLFTRWDVYPLWARLVPATLKLVNLVVWDKGNHTAGDLTGNLGFRWEGIMLLRRADGRLKIRGKRHPNLWEFPRVPAARAIHPAEKPVDLLVRAIGMFSDAGDLVVDPFCGSGATGEAAVRLKRRVLLGDNDAAYVRAAQQRLGLPVTAPQPTRTAATMPLRAPEVCLDALEGLHPEDIREVAALIAAHRAG